MKVCRPVSRRMEENLEMIRRETGGCFDVSLRRIKTAHGQDVGIFYIDGLVSKETIQDNVVRPIVEPHFRKERLLCETIENLHKMVLSACDVTVEREMGMCLTSLLSGDTLLFLQGADAALVIQTRGWKSRGIPEPKTQNSVRGPMEAFCETLLFNTALLRRKIKSPNLRFEMLKIGAQTRTDVCIAYLEGTAKPELLGMVRRRLKKINVDYILESGHIEQLIEDHKYSLFPTVGNNEKPDIVAAKLLKGRVAVFVDGTPFVLTVPLLFVENFHTAEDYYTRPYYANMLRILRILSYIITLCLPAAYIALVNFHPEMIPQKLLYTIMKAKDGIPFPSELEVFLMLMLYEILREAVLRLPTPVGSTVGIVGGLIIGEAAVSAGIVGGPVVVVAAVTFMTSAAVNPTMDSTALLRLILLVLAGFMGIFGILLGIFGIFAHLCSLKSFGVPYMMPISPVSKQGAKDAVIRTGIRGILRRRRS